MITPEYVNWIRRAELDAVKAYLKPGQRILEIGAGTGQQALELRNAGFEVEAVDLASSNYAEDRVFPVTEYDGGTLPFPDASFDVVFSSNTLEHILDLRRTHAEIKRVLKPGGTCLHVVPTSAWQFWTIISGYPEAISTLASARSRAGFLTGLRRCARAVLPARHGERGNAFLELWLFSATWWRRHFRRNGFEIVSEGAVELLYTGNAFFGPKWSLATRRKLARHLGSASQLFLLRVSGQIEGSR